MKEGFCPQRFSRWLRGLCTIGLSRNTASDRLKTIGYIEQALSVLEQYHEGDQVWALSLCISMLMHLSKLPI